MATMDGVASGHKEMQTLPTCLVAWWRRGSSRVPLSHIYCCHDTRMALTPLPLDLLLGTLPIHETLKNLVLGALFVQDRAGTALQLTGDACFVQGSRVHDSHLVCSTSHLHAVWCIASLALR